MLDLSGRQENFFQGYEVRAPNLPWRLVYSFDAPAVTHAGAVDPVDAGDRAILDCERERGFGMEVERQCQRGADRAAMRDGNDFLSGMRLDQLVDGTRHPLDHRNETLAARRGLMR